MGPSCRTYGQTLPIEGGKVHPQDLGEGPAGQRQEVGREPLPAHPQAGGRGVPPLQMAQAGEEIGQGAALQGRPGQAGQAGIKGRPTGARLCRHHIPGRGRQGPIPILGAVARGRGVLCDKGRGGQGEAHRPTALRRPGPAPIGLLGDGPGQGPPHLFHREGAVLLGHRAKRPGGVRQRAHVQPGLRAEGGVLPAPEQHHAGDRMGIPQEAGEGMPRVRWKRQHHHRPLRPHRRAGPHRRFQRLRPGALPLQRTGP